MKSAPPDVAISRPTMPLVSVGIPTFNRPDLLQKRLENVLGQSYPNLEVIVSDNASTDPAVGEIITRVSAADSRVRASRQKENVGRLANFHLVLQQANGEFFLWAADDDWWAEHFVEFCVGNIGDADLLASDMEVELLTSGARSVTQVPELGPQFTTVQNASRYLSDMQPGLIYGLHRREALLRRFDEATFDLADCFLVYSTILADGVITRPGATYRAGVTSERYIPKASAGDTTNLSYRQFVFRMLHSTLRCNTLTLREKAALVFGVLAKSGKLVAHLATEYPEQSKVHHRMLARAFSFARRTRNQLRRIATDVLPSLSRSESYSQCGEDLIVDFALRAMGIEHPTYLDVGANHPFRFSNTFAFYRRGNSGVTVEPDPALHRLLSRKRPRDIHINAGVGATRRPDAKFFLMSERTLNTFSEDEASRHERLGTHRIDEVRTVPIVPIGEIIGRYFDVAPPDFLSIDVEGLDAEIVGAIDFERMRPAVICVETIDYNAIGEGRKNSTLIDLIKSKNYIAYADTYINSIFVDADRWMRGKGGVAR